jgi:hypothetical protein
MTLVTNMITWPAVNWPTSTGTAGQYTVLQVYPGPVTALQNVTTTSASLTYDDSANLAFQIRPSSGSLPTPTYGPEVMVYVIGFVPCRAWLRQKVRVALADRADTVGVTLNWPDDELNQYISEAIAELNVFFPYETSPVTITLLPPSVDSHGNTVGTRTYNLPSDFYLVKTIEYVTSDSRLHLYLKDKPWRGGETTATSYLGYPKLGILLSPLAGRYYPGHYSVFNSQVTVDWDPAGDGDYLNVTYLGQRPLPANDGDLLVITVQDAELMSLYTQFKAWMRIEGQDTRLSRWRDKADGSRRDDMPTLRQSAMIRSIYQERINDRREQRPRIHRLVRR